MGVKGLWRLLLPIGRRISIEVLEGKILAIDASIWLTQFVKAMRDEDTGSIKAGAHLIGFFRRLAKLRFHGIRPVLVFDGPTPIIKLRELELRRKRREQFAVESSHGAVQRTAKRLLINQLKKIKGGKHKAPAFAPGFNQLTEQEEDSKPAATGQPKETHGEGVEKDEAVESTSEQIARRLQEEEWQTGTRATETSEEIARALQEDEWQSEQEKQLDRESDWDKPLATIPEEHEDGRKKRKIDHHLHKKDGINVEFIASMAPSQRKDAIEEAKRAQRMRSRREFMPVAAVPEDYSQVQLRNFLRSSKLNKDIVKMAQEAAKNDCIQEGEIVASDPSRRIIFEKFDEPKKAKPDRLVRHRKDDSDESDDEFEWEDAQNDETPLQSSGEVSRNETTITRKVVIETDDSDSDGSAHDVRPIQKPSQQVAANLISIDDSSSSDESGGFLKPHREAPVKKAQIMPKDAVDLTQTNDNDAKNRIGEDVIEEEADIEWEEGDEAQTMPYHSVDLTQDSCIHVNNRNRDDSIDDEEDDIDWEEGHQDSSKSMAPVLVTGPSQATNDDGIFQVKASTEPDTGDYAGEYNDFVSTINSQNADALKDAQATASNLADWAGRAFRRALARHEKDNNINSSSAAPLDGSDSKPRSIPKPPLLPDTNNNLNPVNRQTFSDDVTTDEQQRVSVQAKPASGQSSVLHVTKDSKRSPSKEMKTGKSSSSTSLSMETLIEAEAALKEQQRRSERDMDTYSDEMKGEIIKLIQLFGIPFVEAPAEAEAQCVALEELGLVDGIVTEDSDVFVFGGQTIYKNIFQDQKYVEVYHSKDAAAEMSLGKNEMVGLAMLLGGDYTSGVKGVGIVNSMEILEAFDLSQDTQTGLQEFRKWLDGFDPSDAKVSSKSKSENDTLTGLQKFHTAHRSARSRWECPESFPADNVLNAYHNPVVDRSPEQFSWGIPDMDNLIIFCSRNMGWEPLETSKMLEPIMKRLEDGGMRQTRLDSFMKYSDEIRFANVRSKRLRDVIQGTQREASAGNTSSK